MKSIFTQKKELREIASVRRDGAAASNDIGHALLSSFETAIQPAPGSRVSGYYPIGSEANVLSLLLELAARGMDTALPIVSGREDPLTFRKWCETDSMDRGPFGIPEPQENEPVVRPDLILAPLLAFDRAGNRLGYGGGYYDRTIMATRLHQPVLVIGIAYAAQEVPHVPHDREDVALDWIVTENEAFSVERGNV
jgi:5-formyltetrahydrofolate cyclo-ligase